MSLPLQITFHGVDKSEAAENRIRAKADKLDVLTHRIIGCRVSIEMNHRHGHQHFRVAVDVKMPGGEVVATSAPQEEQNLYSAIDQAFDAAGRQLHDLLRRQRGETKLHARG